MKTLKGGPDSLKAIAFFTEEKKVELRKMLTGFPEQDVWMFIQQAQFICQRVLLYRERYEKLEYKRPSRTDHRNELKQTIKSFDETLKLLLKISTGELLPKLHYTLGELGPLYPTGKGHSLSDDPIMGKNVKVSGIAVETAEKLKTLKDVFQEAIDTYPNKPGKPESIHLELGIQIAEAFKRFLGTPSASINEPLPHIFAILFEAVGISLKAPEKLTAKAIKNLPTE